SHAVDMLLKSLQWRAKFDIEELTRMNEDDLDRKYEGFKRLMESGKIFFYGRDKMNRTVIYVTSQLHRPHDQPKSTMEKFLVYLLECGRLLMHPSEETCLVIDLAGFGMGNVDYHFIKFTLHCIQHYYPGYVGLIILLSPSRTLERILKVIHHWLMPATRSKIRLAHDPTDLQTYIDAEKLPAVYGGKVKCEFEYIPPAPGENDSMMDYSLRERAQQAWRVLMWKMEALMRMRVECADRMEAAVEDELEETVAEIRVAFFQLRSYTSAKTMFERSEHPPLRYDGTVAWSYPLV
ncbi:hypothetical protein EC968_007077, partial [Mortierella alpina]